MPNRPASFIPPDLRSRLETARLDTLALLRAIDQALISPRDLPEIELQALYELDADCAEALWALDQPPGSLNFKAMLRDTLASLQRLPHDRDLIRSRIIPTAHGRVIAFEKTIRASLDPREAYNDIPPPHSR